MLRMPHDKDKPNSLQTQLLLAAQSHALLLSAAAASCTYTTAGKRMPKQLRTLQSTQSAPYADMCPNTHYMREGSGTRQPAMLLSAPRAIRQCNPLFDIAC
jgi:uncharacterized protein (DUF2345 family)